MHRFRNTVAASILAAGLVFAMAPAASAYPGDAMWPGTPAKHGSFTRNGLDYVPVYLNANHSQTGATCVGHSDYFKRRQVLCPWCTWYYGWFVHCTQV